MHRDTVQLRDGLVLHERSGAATADAAAQAARALPAEARLSDEAPVRAHGFDRPGPERPTEAQEQPGASGRNGTR